MVYGARLESVLVYLISLTSSNLVFSAPRVSSQSLEALFHAENPIAAYPTSRMLRSNHSCRSSSAISSRKFSALIQRNAARLAL